MSSNDNTKTAAYENYPANNLTRGANTSVPGGSPVLSGSTALLSAEVGEGTRLDVEAYLYGGSADTDLTVLVFPVDNQGNNIGGGQANFAIPAQSGVGPVNNAGTVTFWSTYDVSGQDRVQIRVTNNNAATKNISLSFKVV